MSNQTCLWFVSMEQPECGEPAVAIVRVKDVATSASVPLCRVHKAKHDDTAARIRNDRRQQKVS